VRPFAGTSLIEIALAKLDRMDFFDHRYLAVAEEELKGLARRYPNVEVLHRDSAAVKQGVNPQTVTFKHYLDIPSDYVFAFNPCLPNVSIETIRKAYDYVQSTDHLSYMAAMQTGDWIFDADGNPLTNTDPGNATTNKNRTFFKATHAFYVVSKKRFADQGLLWTLTRNDPHLIPMPEHETVDVDTETEFRVAEAYWMQQQGSDAAGVT
jgi:CMP-N-acetylneuraminic acid synthetase